MAALHQGDDRRDRWRIMPASERRARFQVVAVYPSGNRYDVRPPHTTYLQAEAHRARCERTADPGDTWTYSVDCYYTGSDGQTHWRGDVTGESLGYTPDEVNPA